MSKYESLLPIRPSVIRKYTILASQHNAVDFGQGFPSLRPPIDACVKAVTAIIGGDENCAESILSRSVENHQNFETLLKALPYSIDDQLNQYSNPRGSSDLHRAIAKYYKTVYNCEVDPLTEVTVTLGSTEGISVVLRTLVPSGDAVVFIQPFHEMYINQARVFNIKTLVVSLKYTEGKNDLTASEAWTLDMADLEEAVTTSPYTVRALVLNNPHNPTGKVFTEQELLEICEFCKEHKIWLIKDDVYEHVIFKDFYKNLTKPQLPSIWTWKAYRPFTIIISSISKTASATGWRVGWVLAPSILARDILCYHDNIAMQAPTIFQYATLQILSKPLSYFIHEVPTLFAERFQILGQALVEAGFRFARPEGSFFLLATYQSIPPLASLDSSAANKYLITHVGVAAISSEAFFDYNLFSIEERPKFLRFAFCKSKELIQFGSKRLLEWKKRSYQPLYNLDLLSKEN